jgi:hypothetical protein
VKRSVARCALFGLIAFAPAALAYRTASELPELAGTERVRWALPFIGYVLHPDLPSGLARTDVEAALDLSFRAWTTPACSGVGFVQLGAAPTAAMAEDGVNTVQWLRSGWSELGAPSDAAALTDVVYERGPNGDWVIVEADLYLNADDHTWTLDGRDGARDVRAVVTHESGHILGLLHPCELGGEAGAPDCDDVPEAARATMFPVYSVEHETLAADDEAGVCYLYPKADGEGSVGEAAEPARFGAACSEAADCLDGQCLAGLTQEPVCTRLCDRGLETSCPTDWQCTRVDTRDVCTPALAPDGGASCQLSPAAPDAGPLLGLFLSIVFASSARRRSGRVLGAR